MRIHANKSLLRLKVVLGYILLVFIITINSCEKNIAQPIPIPSGCDTNNLTYTNAIQIIININCGSMNTSCHAPGVSGRGDFSNYASLQHYATGGEKSLFYRYVYVQKKMPIAPELPLDACTSVQLKAWIMDGAPQ
jgi:hypothetical protein